MDETGVLGLLEELSILLEDAKPVFGKNNLRQVDVSAAFEIIDEIPVTATGKVKRFILAQILKERMEAE